MGLLRKLWRRGWRIVSDADTIFSFLTVSGLSGVAVLAPIKGFAEGHTGLEIFVLTIAALALVLVNGMLILGLLSNLLGRRAHQISRLLAEGRGILVAARTAVLRPSFDRVVDVDYENWASVRTFNFLKDEYSEAVAVDWHGISPVTPRRWGTGDPYREKRLSEIATHIEKLEDILKKEINK